MEDLLIQFDEIQKKNPSMNHEAIAILILTSVLKTSLEEISSSIISQ